jgi:hypothetical protein
MKGGVGLGEIGQSDKLKTSLTAAGLPRSRRDHDEARTPAHSPAFKAKVALAAIKETRRFRKRRCSLKAFKTLIRQEIPPATRLRDRLRSGTWCN